MRPHILVLTLLVVILPAMEAVSAIPQRLTILSAEKVGGYIVYAGYLAKGFATVPVVGFIGPTSASYLVGPYGSMTRVRVVNSTTAIAVGSVLTRGGMAAAVVFITPSRGLVTGLAVKPPSGSLYGGDVYAGRNGIVLAATLTRISKGANTSAVTRESDCLVTRITGRTSIGVVVGSPEYDDYAVLLLRREGGYTLLGETWSYKVSQSAVFVAGLDEDLRLEWSHAYDTSSEDTVSDAAYRGGVLYIGGYSEGEDRVEPLLIEEGAGGWHAYTLSFTGGGYVDRLDGRSVSGTCRLSERHVLYAYTYSGGRLTLYRSNGLGVTPLTPNGSLLLIGTSTIVAGSKGYCVEPCNSTVTIKVLDASKLARGLLRRGGDVRRVEDVLREKGTVPVEVVELRPVKIGIKFREASVKAQAGVYEERVDWGYRVMVFIGIYAPFLAILLPLAVAALLAWAAARRHRG